MKPAVKKVLSLILAILMIAPLTCVLQGCKFVDEIKDKMIDVPAGYLSKQELARLIINAIEDKSYTSESFSQIPDVQLNGISYSVFNEYVSILRDMSSGYGKIKSFKFLNDKDADLYVNDLLNRAGRDSVPTAYGKLHVVEPEYADGGEDGTHGFRFFLSEDSGGVAFLSKAFVTDTVAAHNYLVHYFTMLENNNTDGLYALIEPLYDSDIYISSVISAKARYIAEYYMLKVRSTPSEFVYDEVTPFVVHVFIPKVVGEDGESITTHDVTLYAGSDGNYRIDDNIPWYLDSGSIGIYDSSQNLIRVQGVTLNESKLRALLGDPIVISKVDLKEDEAQASGKSKKVRAFYNGIIFDFYCDENNKGEWFGDLGDVVIYNSNYSIDGHISPGMNKTELLLIYPMIDEADYTFTFAYGKTNYVVDFEFDDNNNIRYVSVVRADLYKGRS